MDAPTSFPSININTRYPDFVGDVVQDIWQLGCIRSEATHSSRVRWKTELPRKWLASKTYLTQVDVGDLAQRVTVASTAIKTTLETLNTLARRLSTYGDLLRAELEACRPPAEAERLHLRVSAWISTVQRLLQAHGDLVAVLKPLEGVAIPTATQLTNCQVSNAGELVEFYEQYLEKLAASAKLRSIQEVVDTVQKTDAAVRLVAQRVIPQLDLDPLKSLGVTCSIHELYEILGPRGRADNWEPLPRNYEWAYLLECIPVNVDLARLSKQLRSCFPGDEPPHLDALFYLLVRRRYSQLSGSPQDLAQLYHMLVTCGLDVYAGLPDGILTRDYRFASSALLFPYANHHNRAYKFHRYVIGRAVPNRFCRIADTGTFEFEVGRKLNRNVPPIGGEDILGCIRASIRKFSDVDSHTEKARLLEAVGVLEKLVALNYLSADLLESKQLPLVALRSLNCLIASHTSPNSKLSINDYSHEAAHLALLGVNLATEQLHQPDVSQLSSQHRMHCVGIALRLIAQSGDRRTWNPKSVSELVLNGLGHNYWSDIKGGAVAEWDSRKDLDNAWKARVYLAITDRQPPQPVKDDRWDLSEVKL